MADSNEQPQGTLGWMYKGLQGHVDADAEEYLVGRRIDKTFEIAKKGDLEIDSNVVPKPVIGTSSSSSCVTVDSAAKMREDPLYEIRKKELDARMEILNNPMRMKKIKALLQRSLSSDDSDSSEDERRHKRKKKDVRHKHRADRKHHRNHKHHRERSSSSKRDDDRRSKSNHDSRNGNDERRRGEKDSRKESDRSHRERSPQRRRSPERSRDGNHSPANELRNATNERSDEPVKSTQAPHPRPGHKAPRPKLSAEELERRRKEMMSAAQSREEERREKVDRYRKEEEEEKSAVQKSFQPSSHKLSALVGDKRRGRR